MPADREGALQKVKEMPGKRLICECCERSYRSDRYNRHHQKYCTRPECVLERKRKRQRESVARRYREDPEFAQKTRERCSAANRRRRAAAGTSTVRDDSSAAAVAPLEVIAGLLSQLTDTTDPVQVRASLLEYAARGRRAALLFSSDSDPPRDTFFGVTRHSL